MAPIAALSADHEYLLEYASATRRALGQGDIRAARVAFDALLDRLREHTTVEERGLFAELRAEGSMVDHVERLESEHRDLWAAVDALQSDGPEWPLAVVRILDDLSAHVWVEEYDIFPASVVGLSSDGWNRVIDTVAPVHEEV